MSYTGSVYERWKQGDPSIKTSSGKTYAEQQAEKKGSERISGGGSATSSSNTRNEKPSISWTTTNRGSASVSNNNTYSHDVRDRSKIDHSIDESGNRNANVTPLSQYLASNTTFKKPTDLKNNWTNQIKPTDQVQKGWIPVDQYSSKRPYTTDNGTTGYAIVPNAVRADWKPGEDYWTAEHNNRPKDNTIAGLLAGETTKGKAFDYGHTENHARIVNGREVVTGKPNTDAMIANALATGYDPRIDEYVPVGVGRIYTTPEDSRTAINDPGRYDDNGLRYGSILHRQEFARQNEGMNYDDMHRAYLDEIGMPYTGQDRTGMEDTILMNPVARDAYDDWFLNHQLQNKLDDPYGYKNWEPLSDIAHGWRRGDDQATMSAALQRFLGDENAAYQMGENHGRGYVGQNFNDNPAANGYTQLADGSWAMPGTQVNTGTNAAPQGTVDAQGQPVQEAQPGQPHTAGMTENMSIVDGAPSVLGGWVYKSVAYDPNTEELMDVWIHTDQNGGGRTFMDPEGKTRVPQGLIIETASGLWQSVPSNANEPYLDDELHGPYVSETTGARPWDQERLEAEGPVNQDGETTGTTWQDLVKEYIPGDKTWDQVPEYIQNNPPDFSDPGVSNQFLSMANGMIASGYGSYAVGSPLNKAEEGEEVTEVSGARGTNRESVGGANTLASVLGNSLYQQRG